MVQIRGTQAITDELVNRFEKDPKPMYYPEALLRELWAEYLETEGVAEAEVDPDAFVSWGFRRLVEHRIPLYEAIARNWGVTVEAAEIEALEAP
ncbi:MAG: ATPase, partial [Gammaproteobacteria bacterium]|nr:ATPase [Gammaproteobacteria bacterium]